MKRQILCVLTATVLLLLSLSMSTVAEENVEFIKNGGFENLKSDGTTLMSWSVLEGDNARVSAADTAADGKKSVRLVSAGADDKTRIIQKVEGMKPGGSYVLTASLYGLNTKGFAHIKVESDKQSNNTFLQELNVWSKTEIHFTLSDSASTAWIYIGAYNGAEVLWDSVSLIGPRGEEWIEPEPEVPDIVPPEGEVVNIPDDSFVPGLSPLIENGGFETGETWPSKWTKYSNSQTVYEIAFGHESEKSLMITNTDRTVAPYVRQRAEVYGGGTYQLGMWFCIERAENATSYAAMKLEFYAEGGSALGEETVKTFSGTNGKWMQYVHSFTPPPGTAYAYVYARQYGIGTVWVDNVSLGCLVKPDAISVTTDEVFYYSDHTDAGIAEAVIQEKAYPELSGASVDFRLTKDGAVLHEERNVPSVDGIAVFSFDISFLREKKTEYRIEVSCGEHTNFWRIYKYDRPEYLGSDGIFRKNGKEIRPVIAYNYTATQYGYGLKDAGINISVLSVPTNLSEEELIANMRSKLDTAKEAGIMCLVATYSDMLPGGNEANRARTELLAASLNDHDALFGWMNMDEPFLHASDPHDDLRQTYISIRNYDPYHPVYTTEQATMLKQSGWYVDILGVDPYPGSSRAPETYPDEKVTAAIRAVNGRKPVYSVLQAYEWSNYFPTGDEIRNMLYQSFLAGAKGIGYFRFTSAKNGADLDETTLWPVLSAFYQNEQEDAFNAFVYDKYPIFSDLVCQKYRAVSFVKENSLHVVILKRKKETQTVYLPLKSITGSFAVGNFVGECVYGGKGESVAGTGILEATLAPSAAAVYKIRPEEITALTDLDDIRFSECVKLQTTMSDVTYTGVNCWSGQINGDFILQNAGTAVETVTVQASAQVAEIVNGVSDAVFSGGMFSIHLSGGDTVRVKFHDTKPTGVYRGNVKYNKLSEGETYAVFSENGAMTAMYGKIRSVPELIGMWYNGETFTAPLKGKYEARTFYWDTMRPQ